MKPQTKTYKHVTAENVTRKKILFYPGKRFKQMLEGMSVTTMEDYDEEETAGQEPEPGGGTEQGGTDPDEGGGGFT